MIIKYMIATIVTEMYSKMIFNVDQNIWLLFR